VNDVPALTSRIHHIGPDGTDAERSFIRRLAPASGIESGPIQCYLAAFELYDARFELFRVGIF
jgi:hypothetical protein